MSPPQAAHGAWLLVMLVPFQQSRRWVLAAGLGTPRRGDNSNTAFDLEEQVTGPSTRMTIGMGLHLLGSHHKSSGVCKYKYAPHNL